MICNDCGNEAHCGEILKDEINGVQTIECKRCKCTECKQYEETPEDLFNGA